MPDTNHITAKDFSPIGLFEGRLIGVPELTIRDIDRRASVHDLVAVNIARSVNMLVVLDASTRLGEDPGDLRRFRVASRRLRSALRAFRQFLEPGWTSPLSGELRWLGAEVGAVRDLDVIGSRLATGVARLTDTDADADADAAAGLIRHLHDERLVAHRRLAATMSSRRYLDLVGLLVEAANQPRFAEIGSDDGDNAARVLPKLVLRGWRRTNRAMAADGPLTDEQLHDVRVLVRRCRYLAETCADVCGEDAQRFARALKDVQHVLGSHHDAAVSEAWLRATASTVPMLGLVAGQLVVGEAAVRAELRHEFDKSWLLAARPALRAWCK